MNLDKSLFKKKTDSKSIIDNEYILTEWLMRNCEADFGQSLKGCNILQITQLLKIQRRRMAE